MAEQYYSSLQVAKMLNVHNSRLSRAVWEGRIDPPAKSPGKGVFLWTRDDIERASWILRRRDASDILIDSASALEPQAVKPDLSPGRKGQRCVGN
ncbi:MAG: helix-turn-helix domain-containing protein [Planctomycetes bacterium]|nr:helix-turn-helix domain-containing protein [Planctomycetota bacterium]